MICFPNCKINIGLYITNKRNDGYHDLETIFYPVNLYDVLELVPGNSDDIHIHGKAIDGDQHNNLVWKAYQLIKHDYPHVANLDIHLLKNIPMGAGLGGGSADGAYMLKLINDFYQLEISTEKLEHYALSLGSDCPFFIRNTPQFATGRGELMQPVNIDLSAYNIQLICPGVHVSTAGAFKMITPKKAPFDLRRLPEIPIERWVEYVSNDFEEPVFIQHPELADIKQQLYNAGAIYAAMSGSGSTLYGIFKKGNKADITVESYYIQ